MTKVFQVIIIFCLLQVICSVEGDDTNKQVRLRRIPRASSRHVWRTTSIANKYFAHRLFRAVARATPDGNFFISPYAVASGLSMTLYGARGRTKEQIINTLGYSLVDSNRIPRLYEKMLEELITPDHGFTLVSANRLFGEKTEDFEEQFIRGTEKYYGAPLMQVDFSGNPDLARATINRWVANVTQNTIQEAMPPDTISSNTKLALVSTLYFNGQWKVPFLRQKRANFRRFDGEVYETKFMQAEMLLSLSDSFELAAQWIQIPYHSSSGKYRVAMEIILPYDRSKAGMQVLEKRLTEDTLFYTTSRKRKQSVQLMLPQFRLEYGRDLQEILARMGIEDLFSVAAADLSGISRDNNLAVGAMEHKTFLDVNMEGTTAGASLGQDVVFKSNPVQIDCNHPFIVILRETYTKMPLFMGRIAEPGR
ncbi:unnamed protein product [Clavelina lepadiformis]|uniref:Serpin domain-containing protein n=1 Tax=Clavelina lepadiformis TaxID=159417 RepID=A0ABP0F4I5_CLALP